RIESTVRCSRVEVGVNWGELPCPALFGSSSAGRKKCQFRKVTLRSTDTEIRINRMAKPVLPILTGRSVLLRPPRRKDAAARLVLGVHPEIVRMYGGSSSDICPMTAEAAERWVLGLMKHGYAWIIEAGSSATSASISWTCVIDGSSMTCATVTPGAISSSV